VEIWRDGSHLQRKDLRKGKYEKTHMRFQKMRKLDSGREGETPWVNGLPRDGFCSTKALRCEFMKKQAGNWGIIEKKTS